MNLRGVVPPHGGRLISWGEGSPAPPIPLPGTPKTLSDKGFSLVMGDFPSVATLASHQAGPSVPFPEFGEFRPT